MQPTSPLFSPFRLGTADLHRFQSLIQLFNRVFEAPFPEIASDTRLQALLNKPGFAVYVVCEEEEVVGGATAYELPLYTSDRGELFVYDMAVKPEYQHQGVGKALIDALKQHATDQDLSHLFVPAHASDTGALAFYRACGGEAEQVVHFNFPIA